MFCTDRHELPVTGADEACVRAYDAYVVEFLSYGSRLRDLFAVADAYPGSALVNAHAAALHLAFEGAEGWRHAQPYLQAMRSAPPPRFERERRFCAAVELWAARRFHDALAALDALTEDAPGDICALKWAQYHAFNLGDKEMMLRLAERTLRAHRGEPYAHGVAAFALEQNGRLGEAEAEGYRAVEIAIDDAWAHHAVAHVMETTGRAEDGVSWLDRCSHTWERKGVFIRDHNWWHAALFRLSLDRTDEAVAIFDERLWGVWPEFPQEQIGAVSMLWRLEMRGVDVGGRWRPVAEQARARAGEHLFAFHDLHYLFALARAGEPGEAEAFLASMRAHGDALDGPAREAWLEACLPCAEGVLAYADGRYREAAGKFALAAPGLNRVGGSHAQRALFAEARHCALSACSAAAVAR